MTKKMFILVLCAATVLIFAAAAPANNGALKWGGDSEGGFPYMFPNPKNTDELIGFEVDIVKELTAYLDMTPEYVNNAWDNLIPGLDRGLYDIAINGLEVTPEHEETVNFSIPSAGRIRTSTTWMTVRKKSSARSRRATRRLCSRSLAT